MNGSKHRRDYIAVVALVAAIVAAVGAVMTNSEYPNTGYTRILVFVMAALCALLAINPQIKMLPRVIDAFLGLIMLIESSVTFLYIMERISSVDVGIGIWITLACSAVFMVAMIVDCLVYRRGHRV